MSILPRDNILRSFNNCLSFVVLLLAVYIILSPFLPQLGFMWQTRFGGQANSLGLYVTEGRSSEELPASNTLFVPRLHMEEVIYEGPDARTLRHGLWRRPHTSTPDKGGNTVVVGHRFTFNGPSTFYHLDKMQVGDRLVLAWEKRLYTYEVVAIDIVRPDQVEVEAATDEPVMTLYTCTPLWSAKDRLVVRAKLVGGVE